MIFFSAFVIRSRCNTYCVSPSIINPPTPPKPADRDYRLGLKPGFERAVIEEKYLALKPCLHGCDAHSIDRIGKPDQNRTIPNFCIDDFRLDELNVELRFSANLLSEWEKLVAGARGLIQSGRH